MITIYWHCLGLTGNDERFLADALNELAQVLRKEPIKLLTRTKRLGDKPDIAKQIDAILNRLNEQSYTFSNCARFIQYLFFKDGIFEEGVPPKLLVYCRPDSHIAQAALREKPSACWGATCGFFSAVYKPNNKFTIWHEAVHLLLLRGDDKDECYEPYPPYAKKGDCDCESCLMKYAPSEKTVGEWPSICDKVIKLLQNVGRKEG